MKTTTTTKDGFIIVATTLGKKGKWFTLRDRKKLNYFNRLVSRNGKIICNNYGFNSIASAKKNIKAVQASA
jgi:uncharacterized protein YegP (UPF0339 family)